MENIDRLIWEELCELNGHMERLVENVGKLSGHLQKLEDMSVFLDEGKDALKSIRNSIKYIEENGTGY